jgi:hypothetical protein
VFGKPSSRVTKSFSTGPNGRALTPAKWASYNGANPCGADADNRTKTLASFAPFADFNQASFTPGKFLGPLVAQNGAYVRYEVRINEAEFNSIVGHRWFERGLAPSLAAPPHFDVGSIAVKAAWRILDETDTPAVRSRHYVVTGAQVIDVAKTLAAGKPVCVERDVVLVGLHITVKTKYRPQGLWSTFEHVDNVPPVGSGDAREPDAKDAKAPYSFNDPAKEQTEVEPPLDSPLAQPVGPTSPPKVDPAPTQVVRRHSINPETMAMNRAY